MALVPLATKGNYFHVYDFHVKPGAGRRFQSSCSTSSIMATTTRSTARRPQVKDGGPVPRLRPTPDHFYLIGEWRDIEEHRRNPRGGGARDPARIRRA